MGGQLRRGEEQEVLRCLPLVPDTSSRYDGRLVHTSRRGEQAEVAWLLDYRARGDLHALCTESDHLPLLHLEQEHHHLGVLVVVRRHLPAELAAEVWVTVGLWHVGKHPPVLLLQPSSGKLDRVVHAVEAARLSAT